MNDIDKFKKELIFLGYSITEESFLNRIEMFSIHSNQEIPETMSILFKKYRFYDASDPSRLSVDDYRVYGHLSANRIKFYIKDNKYER